MVPAARAQDAPGEIDAIPENLLREPLDYLYADHFRQLTVCDILEDIALDPAAPDVSRHAAAVSAYMERELPLHIADEEEDLFPRLSERCAPADRIERIRILLSEEHKREGGLAEAVIAGLRSLATGQPLDQPSLFLRAAAALAEGERRHLAWENNFVLPLAKQRLTPDDLQEIGRGMAERRGIAYPE